MRRKIGITCLLAVVFATVYPTFGQMEFRGSPGEVLRFPVANIDSPVISRSQASDAVYNTNFGPSSDINEDLWPDDWTQFFGEGFPRFLRPYIATRRTPFGTHCLQIPVQRGGVTVFSPRAEILPGLTYMGNAQVSSRGLELNRIFISLSLIDPNGRILKTTVSEFVVNTDGWKPLATGLIIADHPDAHSVALGLHVIPLGRQDLAGQVEIGQIAIAEQPTIHFHRKNPWQLFTNADEIEISGHITATQTSWYGAKLELRDVFGRVLESRPLAERGNNLDGNLRSQTVGQYGFQWQPRVAQPGFYTATLSLPMPGIDPYTLEPKGTSQSISFAWLEPCGTIANGDFGWSLPGDMTIDHCRRLQPLLEMSGISRLKFPAWLATNSPESVRQQYMLFGEWLAEHRIQAVGVLATPPDTLLAEWQKQMPLLRNGTPIPPLDPTTRVMPSATAIAGIPTKPSLNIDQSGDLFLLPPEYWLPSVEATIFRLGMIVPAWQFGRDDDRSLVGFDGVGTLLGHVDARLQQQGFDMSLGLPWDWVYPFPQYPVDNKTQLPRGFLSLDNEWPLTVDDLSYYLDATNSGVTRQVMLDPIDRRRYPLDLRVVDLVRRMIAAKEHGADAVFLARPFDANFGLFDPVGEPGELFLPWRTTSRMISGKQPGGGFNMPGGSENLLFRGASGSVMAVWNNTPTEEVLFLGQNSMIVDVWGNTTRPASESHRQVIPVGPIPVFVTDLQHDAAMIRQNCRLETTDIPSQYGTPIPNTLYFMNTTAGPLSGSLAIVPPEGVTVEPNGFPLNLLPGETGEQPLTFRLNAQAKSGEQMLRIDVQAGLPDAPLFSVFQPIHIGGGDVSIDLSTRLNRNNELEVYQAFINAGQTPVRFACTLYIPNRPLQKMNVQNQGNGRSDYTYTIPNGRSLLGKPLRVTAKETGGQRVLKYEFIATP